MYLSTTGGGLGQQALDPDVKSQGAAIIRRKIEQGERDSSRLANDAFWELHRTDQWGKFKLKLPGVKELKQMHREWRDLRNLAHSMLIGVTLFE